MTRITLELAYPNIAFRSRTRNWWARLTRVPPECVHLETEHAWMATLAPDTIYLRGKAAVRRQPVRPEVSLCRACLVGILESELAAYTGRVVAFEPDGENFTQYFFVALPDFHPAGLQPEVAQAVEGRLAELSGSCQSAGGCSRKATWLWFSRREVTSLDEFSLIAAAPGQRLCATHAAGLLCRAFEAIEEANLFYINVPYGDSGAYVWI